MTRKPRSSTSKAATYEEIGEYWDSHDLVSVGVADKPAEFEVDIKRRRFLVAIEPRGPSASSQKGLSAGSLLNLWVQEKCAATR